VLAEVLPLPCSSAVLGCWTVATGETTRQDVALQDGVVVTPESTGDAVQLDGNGLTIDFGLGSATPTPAG